MELGRVPKLSIKSDKAGELDQRTASMGRLAHTGKYGPILAPTMERDT